MLLELPIISQIIALMPRDDTPSSVVVRDKGVFEFTEADPKEFAPAVIMTERIGNREPATVYWKEGDFWAYYTGGVPGVDADEAQIAKADAFKWHWFASVIAPENYLFSHFTSGTFGGFHSEVETIPKRDRIIENYRDLVVGRMQEMFADNVRIVDGALMLKVKEPAYGLYIRNGATKKAPMVECYPTQAAVSPKVSRGLNNGHLFSALDWDGLSDAARIFRKIAPAAAVSPDPPKMDILMPEAFTSEHLTYSARSLAFMAYRGMGARTIAERHMADYGLLYELFEHQANVPGIVDRLVDVMSRVVHLADLEDRLAWELFLERYDNAPISIAF
ncbi:hypothetical protein [Rhizobium sp. BK176]|uniref:hypothetical protein n=1 Tax=Rhizobium sp. BK176 TaxID=2587071 RepID=UPI00216719EC|nr:hypothetical protein [Rhizobium sp. BK176]MCS4089105.1 hypothetical protein [Rhizobium sp. BK176]